MPVTQVHPGLFVMTPHGVGMVMSVRQDGMVVTKLTASATTGGGPAFTGYFHPSSIDPLAAAVPSFSAAASFQPVSPAAYGGFQVGGFSRVCLIERVKGGSVAISFACELCA